MKIETIAISDIIPDEEQGRKHFNKNNLQKLKDSILKAGVSETIEVRKGDNGKYIIVSGERRFRAIQDLLKENKDNFELQTKFSKLDVIIFEGDDYKERALLANLLREDLTHVDSAEEIARFKKEKNISNEELGKIIGKSDATVGVYIATSKLNKTILNDARNRENLSLWILEETTKGKDDEHKIAIWEKLKDGNIPREEYRRQIDSSNNKQQKFNYSRSIKKIQNNTTLVSNLNDTEIVFKSVEEKENLQKVVSSAWGELKKFAEKIKKITPEQNIKDAATPEETNNAVPQEQANTTDIQSDNNTAAESQENT